MTRTRARRLTRTVLATYTIVAVIVAACFATARLWPAVCIAIAVACFAATAAWVIGPPPPARPQSPPRDYQDWRTELEVTRFRGQISEWEATQRSQQ